MSGISPREKRWTETGQTERQPAQQELPLFIYINPADISIFPASSRMLNLNPAPFFSQRIYMSQTGRWFTDLKQPRPLMRSWRNTQNIDQLCLRLSLFSNSCLITKTTQLLVLLPGRSGDAAAALWKLKVVIYSFSTACRTSNALKRVL